MKAAFVFSASLTALGLAAGAAAAQDMPFGTDADAAYAAQLWAEMEAMPLAGDGLRRAFP